MARNPTTRIWTLQNPVVAAGVVVMEAMNQSQITQPEAAAIMAQDEDELIKIVERGGQSVVGQLASWYQEPADRGWSTGSSPEECLSGDASGNFGLLRLFGGINTGGLSMHVGRASLRTGRRAVSLIGRGAKWDYSTTANRSQFY